MNFMDLYPESSNSGSRPGRAGDLPRLIRGEGRKNRAPYCFNSLQPSHSGIHQMVKMVVPLLPIRP